MTVKATVLILCLVVSIVGHAKSCPENATNSSVRVAMDRSAYHRGDDVILVVLIDRADFASNAGPSLVVDPPGGDNLIAGTYLTRSGIPVLPNTPTAAPCTVDCVRTADILTVQQYLKRHPEPFVPFSRPSLSSLGYTDLPPGNYAISQTLTIPRPANAPLIVTTGCVHFDIVPN